ncbi:MAG: hypothetical protein WD847_02255 [Pirellulales bacterium]
MNAPRSIAMTVCCLGALAGGCSDSDQVEQYQVPKQQVLDSINGPPPAEPVPHEDTMLAAIVLEPDQAWFFKLAGPRRAVEDQAERFEALIESLEFGDSGPRWSLPAGWREQAGSGMRYATLTAESGDELLETTVTSLPRNDGDEKAYSLSNINRWRGQMGLQPIGRHELSNAARQVKFAGGIATVVELKGKLAAQGMGQAPFVGRAPFAGQEPLAPGLAGDAGETGRGGLRYNTPEGWQAGQAGAMRKAAFVVAQGDRQVEITVIDLAASAGGLLDNVNRWRGQIGLGNTTEEELDQQVRKLPVGSDRGDYVELYGPEQAILAVIARQGGKSWFIKLMGDKQLAEREKQRFEQFVQSLEFGD